MHPGFGGRAGEEDAEPQLRSEGDAPAALWVRGGRCQQVCLEGTWGQKRSRGSSGTESVRARCGSRAEAGRSGLSTAKIWCCKKLMLLGNPWVSGNRIFSPHAVRVKLCLTSGTFPPQQWDQELQPLQAALQNLPERLWKGGRFSREERHHFSLSKPLQSHESALPGFMIRMPWGRAVWVTEGSARRSWEGAEGHSPSLSSEGRYWGDPQAQRHRRMEQQPLGCSES